MRARSLVASAILLFSLTGAAAAQPPAVENDPPRANEARAASVDVDQLPVDVARIQRKLRQSSVREERDGLRLKYFVDVFGQAPRIELFTPQDNLLNGPVPYGGPTHQEVLQVITPQEFRSPRMDMGNLLRWLSGKGSDK